MLERIYEALQAIDPNTKDYVDWAVVDGRLPPEFWIVFESPEDYMEAAKRIINEGNVSAKKQQIMMRMFVALDMNDYLGFVGFLLQMLEQGKVTSGAFQYMVFPPFEIDTKMVDHHKTDAVRQCLASVLESAKVSDKTKAIVNSILNGNLSKRLDFLRETGQIRMQK